jgi:hypothetical protein
VKKPKKTSCSTHYADLWGLRERKYEILLENHVATTQWEEVHPITPNFFLMPKKFASEEEYKAGWSTRWIQSTQWEASEQMIPDDKRGDIRTIELLEKSFSFRS